MKAAQTEERAAWEAIRKAAGKFGRIDLLLAELEEAANTTQSRWDGPAPEPLVWLATAVHFLLDHEQDDRDAAIVTYLGWLARGNFSTYYHLEGDAAAHVEPSAPAA